jgi:hypothetical protein
MGLDTEFTLDFNDEEVLETFDHIKSFENIEAGISFHVKVEAYDGGDSLQSNVEYVLVGMDDHVAENGQVNKPNESDEVLSDISARVAASCNLFVEPARSCVLAGTDIFVPVGGTNPFTASSGTTGFTTSSKDPSVAVTGFTSPAQGLGWITGVSQGSTQIDVWDGQGCHTVMTVAVLPANGNYVYISNFDPPPYPYSNLTAGVHTKFTFRIFFPPVSGRYVRFNYTLGNLGSSASSNSEGVKQIALTDALTLEGSANGASWSTPVALVGTIPFGYDYLLLWIEYVAGDQTTVLAKSCQAGWLIDQ